MNKKTKWIGGAAIAVALVLAGAGIAVAVDAFDSDDDSSQVSQQQGTAGGSNSDSNSTDNADPDDAPIRDADRTRAEKAAIAAADGGSVTDVDRSDDADHAFEVEVTREDGTEVDVELDADFGVVRTDTQG